MALTSILLMDKIDLDTLRAPLSLIFAEIAQSDEVRRAQLHGSDLKRIANSPPTLR
ncbi:hypothetical protein EDB83DRAFT_2520027 [Lactarius deliciosus]|nr:hypothetical protein EDB83DRAFT_2520027 [Lactarius deliciosus]